MFDIGFAELVVVALVALVVLGPERLPETIRVVTLGVRRVRSSVRQLRADVEKELDVDQLRLDLHNEAVMRQLAQQEPHKPQPNQTQDGLQPAGAAGQQSTAAGTGARRPDGVKGVRCSSDARHPEPGA